MNVFIFSNVKNLSNKRGEIKETEQALSEKLALLSDK